MTIRRSLLILPFLLCCGLRAIAAAPAHNVILILADDLGVHDLGCYGNPTIETPHVDALARRGVRFTQAYAYPTCSPSRIALLTGRPPSVFQMATHVNPHRRAWPRDGSCARARAR